MNFAFITNSTYRSYCSKIIASSDQQSAWNIVDFFKIYTRFHLVGLKVAAGKYRSLLLQKLCVPWLLKTVR